MSMNHPEMTVIFRNDSNHVITVKVEDKVGSRILDYKTMTKGDTLSVPTFYAADCIVVLVS